MHVLGLIAGAVCAAIGVAGAALGLGWGGWAAAGIGLATLVLAQMLYLGWIALAARAGARRRAAGSTAAGTRPAEPARRVVQKG